MAKITGGDTTKDAKDEKGTETPISDAPLGNATAPAYSEPVVGPTNTEEAPIETRSTTELQEDRVIKEGEPDMNAASVDGVNAVGNRYPLTDEARDNLIRGLEAEAAEFDRQAQARRDEVAKLKES